MRLDIDEAVQLGYIKPASSLRMTVEEEDDYDKGLVYEKIPEVLTRGHVVSPKRVDLIQERAAHARYLIIPTKFSFQKVVRIYSIVFSFISKCKRGKPIRSLESNSGQLQFSMFNADTQIPCQGPTLVSRFSQEISMKDAVQVFQATQVENGGAVLTSTDKFVKMALLYLYRKATEEVKAFNSPAVIEKVGTEVDGVLLSSGRILNEMEFIQTAELEVDLGSMGIRTKLPVLDRHSPLAYSIAQYIHWDLAVHRGAETCSRLSMEHVHIIQGAALFREIAQNCPRCAMKRKRYLDASFGPIRENQLAIAPPFWFCQMDLLGPVDVFVPGYERVTRNRQVKQS